MFVNDNNNIVCRLENIHLSVQNKMQPKSEKPPMCPKGQLPQLHLTPPGGQKKMDSTAQGTANPLLLKPQHDIPPTPPPQTKPQPLEFFPQRIG